MSIVVDVHTVRTVGYLFVIRAPLVSANRVPFFPNENGIPRAPTG
jgi:hypothetical protein